MTRSVRTLTSCGILVSLMFLVPLTAAQTAESHAPGRESSKTNVLITVRMGKLEGGQRVPVKTYDLVVADGTTGSKLLSGQRVPFPAAMAGSGEEVTSEAAAMRSFVYQNIGFVVEARAWVVDKKTIKLVADLEDSRIHENGEGELPIVETRQLSINAMLTDGVPLELTRVQGADQSGFVEVEAKILN